MRTYRIYQVDSFTKQKLSGNPAGVVPNADGLSDTEMQQIARELNNSETAFILSPTDNTHDIWVRFFTPQSEVPICGHATIAAHYVRALENKLGATRIYQKTGAGILPVDIVPIGDDYRIIMTQGAITIGETLIGDAQLQLLDALGITATDIRPDCPVTIVSTGHSKVMIGIRDSSLLHRLTPSMDRLVQVSQRIGCKGFYVFTLHPTETILVHGRMFAPAIGIPEDPVTGNANGPLGAYLCHLGFFRSQGNEVTFVAMQGETINRTGTMEVWVRIDNNEPVEVRIIGEATVAFSTLLTLKD